MRRFLFTRSRRPIQRPRALIYGAGPTGQCIATATRLSDEYELTAFMDDRAGLHGSLVDGLVVLNPTCLPELVRKQGIACVILAIPGLSPDRQKQIVNDIRSLGCTVRLQTASAPVAPGPVLAAPAAGPDATNLINRRVTATTANEKMLTYAGRNILISGAGGSIGSELCRQLIASEPKSIILYEMNELALYTIDMELRALADQIAIHIVPVLGSVTDAVRLRGIMAQHEVEVVIHAAAFKHVPLVEVNELAGLQNNVIGTRVIAEIAQEAGVGHFILISSDKAMRPTNVMGASKRLAELVVQDLATRSRATVFSMVRFGNVLGSSGSVIPLFRDQIARGGPVTLTHEDITRYFMTLQEAAHLVLKAGEYARGGDVFALDLGQPIAIRELARNMIYAAGRSVREPGNPGGDIEILVTGLRPGEKLHEEVLTGQETLATPHIKIMRAKLDALSEIEVASALRGLNRAIETGNATAARAVIARWVEGYNSLVQRVV